VGLDGVCMYSKTIVDVFWGTRVRKVGIVHSDEVVDCPELRHGLWLGKIGRS